MSFSFTVYWYFAYLWTGVLPAVQHSQSRVFLGSQDNRIAELSKDSGIAIYIILKILYNMSDKTLVCSLCFVIIIYTC